MKSRLVSANVRKVLSSFALLILLTASLILLSKSFSIHNFAEKGNAVPDTKATLNADGEPVLDLFAHNLIYGDSIRIVYAVGVNLPDGASVDDIRMSFWTDVPDSFLIDSPEAYVVSLDGCSGAVCKDVTILDTEYDTVAFFASAGIYPQNFADITYARAWLTGDDGQVYYSRADKYSVLQYTHSRLWEERLGATLTKAQRNVYLHLLKNGAAAQTALLDETGRLVTDHTVRIEANGGYISVKSRDSNTYFCDGFSYGVYFLGDTVTLTADDATVENAFFGWKNSRGETVSTERSYSFTVTEETVSDVFTAHYNNYGIVNVENGNVNGRGNSVYVEIGIPYTVTAKDRSADKYVFSHWIDESGTVVSTDYSFTAIVSESGAVKNYSAVYKAPTKVSVIGGMLDNGLDEGLFAYGESYTVTATVPAGFRFISWFQNSNVIKAEASFTAYPTGVYEEIVYESTVEPAYVTFEELDIGILHHSSELKTGGHTLSISAVSSNVYAEIVENPDAPSDKVIKVTDNDPQAGIGVYVDVPADGGDWIVFEADFNVTGYGTATPLQFKLGPYMLQFTVLGDFLKVYDSSGSSAGYLDYYLTMGEWHTIKVMLSEVASGSKPKRAYVFIDGVCISESYNIGADSLSSLGFWALKGTELVSYYDDIAIYRTSITAEEESTFEPERRFETPASASEDPYQNAEILLDDAAVQALKAMDEDLFSENIYRWIADLYDPETSAIYFSISGRDNYGYLPDIETVAQAYGVLNTLGIGGASAVLNDEQKANLLSWIQHLQSNRDGYFYHPHWGVSIGQSRRSRDYGNSSTAFSASGALAYRLFDDANYRLSDGTLGTRGVTVPTAYDNNLTSVFGYSAVEAVSRLVLASSDDLSSMPAHLRSERAFVDHLNNNWNSTCKLDGIHERHLCTDSCVIIENPSKSYMTMSADELIITRGYECTSHHECNHTVGHSYSYGHGVTSQGSQIKAAGLGDLCVSYFYDIQETVQASLRDKAEAAYVTENGEDAWNALTDEERASIRKSAENGIWEEQITYSTVSGLLKISGIPGTHGKEFLYAEAAINTAIKVALFSVDDFVSRREAIVSIYNPFNAIAAILRNVNNYGSDKTIRDRAYESVRSRAEELITNTSAKVMCYLMPDGGYSYNMSGYCVNSQGQPVAVNGYVPAGRTEAGEGDVNGTALALGTRSALLSSLGLTVGAPFSGINSLYSGDGYDLDGNGVIEDGELTATHTDVFKSLITLKDEIVKVDKTTSCGLLHTFEDGNRPSSGKVVIDPDNESNHVLEVVDDDGTSGRYASFTPSYTLGSRNQTVFTFDMKVVESSTTGITHQIFVNSGGVLTINMKYTDDGVYSSFTNTVNSEILKDSSGNVIKVDAKKWFTVSLEVYSDGEQIDGSVYYAKMTVTQNGASAYGYYSAIGSNANITSASVYSLNAAKNTVHLDNVSLTTATDVVSDGEYHFDTVIQQMIYGDSIASSPLNEKDKVYAVSGSSASFAAQQYTTSAVIYNFDSLQAGILLKDASSGDVIRLAFKDSSGKVITGIVLKLNEDGTVSFYSANGKILRESTPKIVTDPNGSSQKNYNERDMILDVDLNEWIVVKLEYHYDTSSPGFDIVVRYADDEYNGYYRTVASALKGVDVFESGANPRQFTEFEFTHITDNGGTVYYDDLYVRNVYVECVGEHNYIDKISSAYFINYDEYGHSVYYKSCKHCGISSSEQFVLHDYTDKNIGDSHKKSDATLDASAFYYYSCVICHENSTETFAYGFPLVDSSKHNFKETTGDRNTDLPDYLTVNGYSATAPSDGIGLWAKIEKETVDGAVNYYLNLTKKKTGGTHALTFKSNVESASKYVYEFDIRWHEVTDPYPDGVPILVKVRVGSSISSYSVSSSSDGTTIKYYTEMHQNEWHKIRYLFIKNEAELKYDCIVFVDNAEQNRFEIAGVDIPSLTLETRYALKVNDEYRYSNLSVDIDRTYSGAIMEAGHETVELVDKRYLLSEANCISPAIYRKSCALCGDALEDTFEHGEITPHSFANIIRDDCLVSDATMTAPATYYKSCKVCGTISNEVFELGESLALTFDKSALPDYISLNGYKGFDVEHLDGLWGVIMEESVENAVNRYLNVGKENHKETHALTFTATLTPGVKKYVIQFDVRWGYATNMRADMNPILYKFSAGASQKSGGMEASVDGTSINWSGKVITSGIWYNVRYEWILNEANTGYDVFAYVDGTYYCKYSVDGTGAPKMLFETRFGSLSYGNSKAPGTAEGGTSNGMTDLSFDIDNVYLYTE